MSFPGFAAFFYDEISAGVGERRCFFGLFFRLMPSSLDKIVVKW